MEAPSSPNYRQIVEPRGVHYHGPFEILSVFEAMRVVHISTIHKALDVRIFVKECRTLAAAGYDVHLVVSTPPAKQLDSVIFHPVKIATSSHRLQRVSKRLVNTYRAYREAVSLKAAVYHFHDPELIPVGILLKLTGAKVVYDAHEDYPRQAFSPSLDQPLWSSFESLVWTILEGAATFVLDAFICAPPTLPKRFPKRKTISVYNFPLLEEFQDLQLAHTRSDYRDRPNNVVYVGGIFATRGIREMVRAIELLPEPLGAKLVLLGEFWPPELKVEIEQMPGWKRVEFLGWQTREGVVHNLLDARAGLVLLHPRPSYVDNYPVKLFEYMAAGLPVIASDFPFWREIVEGAGCGLLANPLDPEAIAEAIQYLLEHPSEAESMGKRGREAVLSRYNWDTEANKLLELYRRLGQR